MHINILKKFQVHRFLHFAALSCRDRRLLSVINSMPVLIRRDDGVRVDWGVIREFRVLF